MFLSFECFMANLALVRGTIVDACQEAGRDPAEVALLPVTKSHPPEAVRYVARAGMDAVGESRVQEGRDKKASLSLPGLRWELIGHLQSNKARLAVEVFDRIQSVDSAKLIDRLLRAALDHGVRPAVLLQVNAGRDPAKFGCEIEEAPALLERILASEALRIEGFMTIAPMSDEPAVAVRTFEALRELRDTLAASFGVALPTLSMGMSGDLRAAVRAGSTQVRVGTALFGARD